MPGRVRTHAWWIGLIILFVALAPASAQEPHPRLRGFYPTGEFDLVVAGRTVDGEILFSRRAAGYLIAPASEKCMYLLLQRQRTVSTVPLDVIRHENGDVDLPRGAAPKRVGRFALRGEAIEIDASCYCARLQPRAPLLGHHDAKAVLEHSPQYGLVMRQYKPNASVLRRLKGRENVTVEVLFGSWCPRCKQTLGNALRVDRDLASDGIRFTYYGLAPAPEGWKDPRFTGSGAKALPTAVVFVNDKVVGRVAPNEWKQFETALAKTLGV